MFKHSHTHTDLQMTDNAVALFFPHAACGWGLQVLLSSNQQVPCCRVTAAMGTAVAVVWHLANGSSQDWKRDTGNDYMNRKERCRVASFPNRAPIHKLVLANKVNMKSVSAFLSLKKETTSKALISSWGRQTPGWEVSETVRQQETQ